MDTPEPARPVPAAEPGPALPPAAAPASPAAGVRVGLPANEIIAGLPARERKLAHAVRRVFALPAAGTGLLCLAVEYAAAAASAGFVEAELSARLLVRRLEQWADPETDRARLRALPGTQAARACIVYREGAPIPGVGRTSIETAIATLMLYVVEHSVPLHRYGRALQSLTGPGSPLAAAMRRAILGADRELVEYSVAPDTPAQWRRLARLFHSSRTWRPTVVPEGSSPRDRRRQERTSLQIKMMQAAFASPFEAVGVVPPRHSLAPAQFKNLAGVLNAALESGSDESIEHAIAIVLVMMLGLRPSQFYLVPLQPEPGAIWLDLARGALRFSLADVISKSGVFAARADEGSIVTVPLHSIVVAWLRRPNAGRPSAPGEHRRLDELFDMHRPGWPRGLKHMLRGASLTSNRLTLGRLIVGAPRLAVLELGVDPLYADATFFVGGVVQRANYHYSVLRPKKIVAAAAAFYRYMGLDGPLSCEPDHDVSLHSMPSDAVAYAFVINGLACVRSAVKILQRPLVPVGEAVDALNAASLWMLAVLVFLFGHRGQLLENISFASISLRHLVWYVLDKFEEAVRPVPLTQTIAGYVRAYLGIVESVATRVAPKDMPLARALRERVLPACTQPLFFQIVDMKIKAIASDALRIPFAEFGLRLNDGRRFLSEALQDAGLSIVVENAVAGRNAPAPVPYPFWFAMAPSTVLSAVRSTVEARVGDWGLPAAPVFQPRSAPRSRASFENCHVEESPATPVGHDRLQSTPAFTLKDGYQLERYHSCKERFEARAFPDPLTNFVFLLVFHGINNKAVLESVLREAVARRIHHYGKELALWALTPSLGLRCVVIPADWKGLIDRLPTELSGDVGTRLDAAAAYLLRSSQTLALDAFLAAARCAHALHLPPLLREYAIGHLAPVVGALAREAS